MNIREASNNFDESFRNGPIFPGSNSNNNSNNKLNNNYNKDMKKSKGFSGHKLGQLFQNFLKGKNLQQKLIKLSILTMAFIIIGWTLLNLFITPINRVLGLPSVTNLRDYSPVSSIEVYDKNDQFITVIRGEEDRQVISLDQIATSLKQALLASEDRAFYQHGGVNFLGIFRAILINLKSGKLRQGGSTITQQLVKNIFFSPKEWSTVNRKFKELLLAIEVEKCYSKDTILEIYLNQVYWGHRAYGVERAAKGYFNKNSSKLNIAESAYLVALLSSPSTLHGTQKAFVIQKQIIKDMVRFGYITKQQALKAENTTLKFESDPGNMSKFPFYMNVVLEEMSSLMSEQELRHSGLKIYTSLDQDAQTQAEDVLNQGIKKAPSGINQGALVTIDVLSNEARVIVGGVGDFWKNQWNRATSPHTIGSAFKPFVYLTSFIKGICSSESEIMDTPFVYKNSETGEVWSPKNFDSTFWGSITVRKALVNSRNIPAIRTAQKATMAEVQELSKKVGLRDIQPYLSSALGSSAVSPLAAANAYAVLARGGIYMKPIVIRRITDKKGSTVYQNNSLPDRVLPSAPIYELIDILVDVVDHGTGAQAKISGLEIAGKTGTADQSRDIWFIGFTPDTVTAVWAGNDKNKKASGYATGGAILAGLWKQYMVEYYKINPTSPSKFPDPLPTKKFLVDPITGLLATRNTFRPEYRELVPGTEPTKFAPPPSPERIEKYLKNMESQRGYGDESEEELEDPDEMEEDLLQDPNSPNAKNNIQNNTQDPNHYRANWGGQIAGQGQPTYTGQNQQVNPNTNNDSVRPVLIQKPEENNVVVPQPNYKPNPSQPTYSQEQIAEQENRKKKLFFRKWRDKEEAPIEKAPEDEQVQVRSGWKRILPNPYKTQNP